MSEQYVNISFDDLVADLSRRLAQKESWRGLTDSSTVMMLLEAIAYATVNTNYYLQRTFEEIFVSTAQFWESLVRMGNLVGYKVKRPVGAEATLRIYSDGTEKVIGAGTVVQINGLDFYFPTAVTVPADQPYIDTIVRQGSPVTYTFTVTASTPFLRFKFGNERTTDRDLRVLVDGTEWIRTDYVLLGKGQHLYELATTLDRAMEVRFGTESTGIPLSGQVVEVHCYETVGSAGNYFGATPEFSGEVEGLTAEVIPPILGGGDLEGVESLRQNIPLFFRLASGFVSKADYEKFVSNIPGVLKAKALDVKDDKLVPFRTVRIYVLPEGGYELTDTFKAELESYLNDLIPSGVVVEIHQPLIRDVRVGVGLRIKRGYDSTAVISATKEAIQALYDPHNLSFGQWIKRTEVEQTALEVAGVKEVQIYYPVDDVLTMKPWEFCRLIQLDVVAF